jgi:hypothetical protein
VKADISLLDAAGEIIKKETKTGLESLSAVEKAIYRLSYPNAKDDLLAFAPRS